MCIELIIFQLDFKCKSLTAEIVTNFSFVLIKGND